MTWSHVLHAQMRTHHSWEDSGPPQGHAAAKWPRQNASLHDSKVHTCPHITLDATWASLLCFTDEETEPQREGAPFPRNRPPSLEAQLCSFCSKLPPCGWQKRKCPLNKCHEHAAVNKTMSPGWEANVPRPREERGCCLPEEGAAAVELEHCSASSLSQEHKTQERRNVGQEPMGTRPTLPSPGAALAADYTPNKILAEHLYCAGNWCLDSAATRGSAQAPSSGAVTSDPTETLTFRGHILTLKIWSELGRI